MRNSIPDQKSLTSLCYVSLQLEMRFVVNMLVLLFTDSDHITEFRLYIF